MPRVNNLGHLFFVWFPDRRLTSSEEYPPKTSSNSIHNPLRFKKVSVCQFYRHLVLIFHKLDKPITIPRVEIRELTRSLKLLNPI